MVVAPAPFRESVSLDLSNRKPLLPLSCLLYRRRIIFQGNFIVLTEFIMLFTIISNDSSPFVRHPQSVISENEATSRERDVSSSCS